MNEIPRAKFMIIVIWLQLYVGKFVRPLQIIGPRDLIDSTHLWRKLTYRLGSEPGPKSIFFVLNICKQIMYQTLIFGTQLFGPLRNFFSRVSSLLVEFIEGKENANEAVNINRRITFLGLRNKNNAQIHNFVLYGKICLSYGA